MNHPKNRSDMPVHRYNTDRKRLEYWCTIDAAWLFDGICRKLNVAKSRGFKFLLYEKTWAEPIGRR